MNAGDVFYFLGPEQPFPHPWTIISAPELDAENVVIVNFTELRDYKDQSCIVQPGEHPTITKPSCINYPKARLLTNAQLENAKRLKALELVAPLSPELLERIRIGAMCSDGMPP